MEPGTFQNENMAQKNTRNEKKLLPPAAVFNSKIFLIFLFSLFLFLFHVQESSFVSLNGSALPFCCYLDKCSFVCC